MGNYYALRMDNEEIIFTSLNKAIQYANHNSYHNVYAVRESEYGYLDVTEEIVWSKKLWAIEVSYEYGYDVSYGYWSHKEDCLNRAKRELAHLKEQDFRMVAVTLTDNSLDDEPREYLEVIGKEEVMKMIEQ